MAFTVKKEKDTDGVWKFKCLVMFAQLSRYQKNPNIKVAAILIE